MTQEPIYTLEMNLGLNHIKDSLGQIILENKKYKNIAVRLSNQSKFDP